MNKAIFIILLFLISTISASSSTFILNEVNEPKTLNVSGDKLILSESESILIYSLSEKKLIKKFGKNGEGPGEFKLGHGAGSLKIDIIDGIMVVNSGGKLSRFSLDGIFISEEKIPPMSYLIPVKNNYVGNCTSPVERNFPSLSICLFGKNLKKSSVIFNSKVPVGMGAKIMVPSYKFTYRVYKDNLFLSTGRKGLEIEVFDSSGNKIRDIIVKNPVLKINEDFKKRVVDFYKNDPIYKNYWNYMKKNMFFPEYFPGLKDMKIDGDKIYIQTYNLSGERFEWLITDLKGKVLKKIHLPQNIESAIAYSPITISNGKYYYLKEDIDEETWELISVDL